MEGFLTGELRRGQATKLITSLSKWINNSSGMALNSHGLLIALFKRLAVLLRNICIWAFSSLESYWGIYFSSFHHVHPYPSMLEQAISTLSFLWKTLWRTREGLKKKKQQKTKETNTKKPTQNKPQPKPPNNQIPNKHTKDCDELRDLPPNFHEGSEQVTHRTRLPRRNAVEDVIATYQQDPLELITFSL